MPTFNSAPSRLAGLDSFIHRYDSYQAQNNCDVSCILLSAVDSQYTAAIGCFRFLEPKCFSSSTNAPHEITSDIPPPIVPQEISRHSPQSSPISPTFHPLPPLPLLPALEVPSFQQFEQIAPEESYTKDSTHSRLSSLSSHDRHENTLVLHHSNSPYVPWPSPQRHEFLRPAFSPSATSHLYSRSGAAAPEPMDYDEIDRRGIFRISTKLCEIHRFVKDRVKSAKRYLYRRRNCVTATVTTTQRRFSVITTDSAMTTSLDTWLASRRRQSLERAIDPETLLTLEEYDVRGSWLDLPTSVDMDDTDDRLPTPAYTSGITDLTLRTRSDLFPPTPSVTNFLQWRCSQSVLSVTSMGQEENAMAQRHPLQSPLRVSFELIPQPMALSSTK